LINYYNTSIINSGKGAYRYVQLYRKMTMNRRFEWSIIGQWESVTRTVSLVVVFWAYHSSVVVVYFNLRTEIELVHGLELMIYTSSWL